MKFKNPANGYVEETTGMCMVWMALFFLPYLVYKGLWKHVFLVIIGFVFSAIMLFIPMILVWIGYILAAPAIIQADYLRRGWIEIPE